MPRFPNLGSRSKDASPGELLWDRRVRACTSLSSRYDEDSSRRGGWQRSATSDPPLSRWDECPEQLSPQHAEEVMRAAAREPVCPAGQALPRDRKWRPVACPRGPRSHCSATAVSPGDVPFRLRPRRGGNSGPSVPSQTAPSSRGHSVQLHGWHFGEPCWCRGWGVCSCPMHVPRHGVCVLGVHLHAGPQAAHGTGFQHDSRRPPGVPEQGAGGGAGRGQREGQTPGHRAGPHPTSWAALWVPIVPREALSFSL